MTIRTGNKMRALLCTATALAVSAIGFPAGPAQAATPR